MSFVTGFSKLAEFGRHSDGTEFKISDTDPAPYSPGTGSMAPSAIASFDPDKHPNSPHKRDIKKEMGLKAALGKFAYADAGASGKSDAASTTATQLKYETTGDDQTENLGYNDNARERDRVKRKRESKK